MNTELIRILDGLSRKPVAILNNAYEVGFERKVNEIWTAHFSLPLDDPKNAHCKPLNYVELTDIDGSYIGLFRIIPANTRKLTTINEVQYECEHVIATLLNDVLFRYHQLSNYTTRDNIEYLLAQQTVKRWRLGACDFTRYFHYKFENENGLLGPLISIAEPFDVSYEWTYDTRNYPWTINLVEPSETPACEIRYGKNLAEIEREVDPSNIANRVYALGAGEGVNQLDITEANSGVPYVEDAQSIAQHGLHSYVWVDRRFEDVDSLLASARGLLAKWSQPLVTYRVKAVDLSSITGVPIDKLTAGSVVRVIDPDIGTFDARIVSERKPDIYDAPYDIELEISNKTANIGTTIADIERRQEINEVYSQGATNIDTRDFADNCDSRFPAVIRFPIPDDVVNINQMSLTYETQPYRAYSRAIKGGGGIVTSTAGGGGTVTSTEAGGGINTSTRAGGGHTAWTALEIRNETHLDPYGVTFATDGHVHGLPYHQHQVITESHTHEVEVPAHAHSVSLPPHTHNITLPDHAHEIEHGIFEYGQTPTAVTIKVDGRSIPHVATYGDEIDILPYLQKDSNGRIARGRYAEIEIKPNNLARINATVSSRLFIQSRIGGNY